MSKFSGFSLTENLAVSQQPALSYSLGFSQMKSRAAGCMPRTRKIGSDPTRTAPLLYLTLNLHVGTADIKRNMLIKASFQSDSSFFIKCTLTFLKAYIYTKDYEE